MELGVAAIRYALAEGRGQREEVCGGGCSILVYQIREQREERWALGRRSVMVLPIAPTSCPQAKGTKTSVLITLRNDLA